MSNESQSAQCSIFWFQWVGASTLGVVLLLAILFIIAKLVGLLLGTSIEDQVPFAPLIGISFGIMQWLVLRRFLPHAGWWVVASTVGFLLGYMIFGVTIELLDVLGGSLLEADKLFGFFYPILGVCLGITGWLVLRNHFVQAGWWIPTTIVGWIVTGLIVGKSIDKDIEILLIGLVPTAIPGLTLAWLLHHALTENLGVSNSAP